MIETETYVVVGPDTQLTYSVEPLDRHARITIGPTTGRGTAIHLLLSDPDMFRSLAETVMHARDDFVHDVLERQTPAGP